MKKTNRFLAWLLAVCMMLGGVASAVAEAKTSDFEALAPLMDLVAAAAMSGGEEPESVPDSDGALSNTFVQSFFAIGASLGAVPEETLANPQKQQEVLASIFSAQLPALAAVEKKSDVSGYIGFRPVTVNQAEGGSIQIIGELYWSEKPLAQLAQNEYTGVQWLERGVFTFRSDSAAQNGFRLAGFSVGTELDMEMAMQDYFDEILVEYVNTQLGFSVSYPAIFEDEKLVEDNDGISAKLDDGSLSFFAKRMENTNRSNLQDYVGVIAGGIPNAAMQVNEAFQYATLAYVTEDGFSVFDVFIVTDKYVYQAELKYRTENSESYHMYTTYLENTFIVDEVSVG